jgi:alkanesulfonate monooxygenase SsuD/methylene tetrahydromethanopterin reductase-like flavin-dependent oxidoreductase (luciferase family)
MAAAGVFAAETDKKAQRLFTSLQQSFVNLRRGTPAPLPPPVDSMEGHWTEVEQIGVDHAFSEAIVGSPATVKRGIEEFVARTEIDEMIVTAAIYDHGARLRSFEIVAEAMIGAAAAAR